MNFGKRAYAMRPEKLRELLRRRPFVAIRVYLSNGTTFDIKHPEMALLTCSTVDIGVAEQEGTTIADRVVYCSLLHVVKVENVDGQAALSN
jgi:hypothetical protein